MPAGSLPAAGERELLQDAFRSFDVAAATLQESYRALLLRLERLDLELAESNEALRRNLRENEEMRNHLSAILESLATGVIVTDQQGVITRCNRAAERLSGMAQADMLGQPLATFLRQAGLDGNEYPVTARSGALLTITRTPMMNQEGVSTGSLLLLQDITAVRRLEERLQRRDRLAAMGEMVGRIAHELRNPLGSVELFASMLRRELKATPDLQVYAEHISSAVHAMNRLLSNLLLYTKPNCPRASWQGSESLVREALTLAAHGTARAGVVTQVSVDPRTPRLWCDALQMKQVLVNLILNAVQVMRYGGTLRIRVGLDEERILGIPGVRVTVSDTGDGIPPEHRSRIFDPFFTTKDEGTGLGLAIVHAIVEAHRGRIDVESTVGCGTTFTIVLPMGPSADDSSPGRSVCKGRGDAPRASG
ncbi:MAG: ATP-binding protein [Nitrospirota bacterium]